MKLRSAMISAAVTVACTASVVTGATANAAPGPEKIGYSAKAAGKSVVVTTTAGSLRTTNGNFEVVDTAGRVAASMPLAFKLDNVTRPIAASTQGRTATLTPETFGRVNASSYLTDPPKTRKQRDDQALNTLGDNLGVATGVGALVGTVIGGVAGCVIGGIIIPAVGCIPGVITGAGFGGVVGTVSAGGPVLIGNVNEYFKTIRSPFVPPKK